jgi:peptide-methionine (R)-S-oxide reductase
MTITRRKTLLYAGASVALLSLGGASAAERFEITRSAAEWRRLLSADEYAVLRDEATEKRYTSPLVEEKRAGLYHCKGCDLAVYSSEHKYDSGTGWPSFWQALPQAVGTKQDNSFFSTRTEVHCLRCGGHFGHIFDDGPAPTGERHCLNGLALTFKPQEA